ncbi:MAG TPA: hypothetical protein VGK34_09535 [Armatimonadota bacterium]
MIKMKNDNPFIFNAHACAIGGFTTRPWGNEVVKSVASVSLPSTGGKVHAEEAYAYRPPFLSVGSAVSDIEGTQVSAGVYLTKITVKVTDFVMYDLDTNNRIVEADFTTSLVTKNDGGKETVVDTSGSQFTRLIVDGAPVIITKGTMCDAAQTYEDFDTKFGTNKKVCKSGKMRLMRCSLIDSISHKHSQPNGDQQILVVPNFGNIYLGEVHIKDNERRITMMRLELGSPVGGSIALGGGSGNGLPFP